MKVLIVIFVIFSFNYTFATENKWHSNWDKYWNIYEADYSSGELEELLMKSNFNIKSLFFTDKPLSLDTLINYFHPVYLNEDEYVDIIYNGTDGSGGDLTAIIFNYKGELKTERKFFATISNFIYRYPFSPSYLIMTEYGCCGFPQQFKYDVILVPKGDSLNIIEGEKICFNKFTAFPELYTMNLPVIVDHPTNSYKSIEFKKGRDRDLLCSIQKGEEGFALAEGVDPGGEKYYFCILYNNTEKDTTCFLRKEDFEFYGKYFAWIPAASVEIIK